MRGGGPPRRHVRDSIRPIRLTVALGLKMCHGGGGPAHGWESGPCGGVRGLPQVGGQPRSLMWEGVWFSRCRVGVLTREYKMCVGEGCHSD